jgi:hypothetical protein
MSDQELVIKISAKNLTGKEFEEARKQVAGLNDETTKSGKKTADAEAAWKKYGDAVTDVGATVLKAGGLITTAIIGVAAATIELGKRGSMINDVRDNFDLLNKSMGLEGKASITTLSTAVDGMISKFDLMKITNQGLSQGLKVSNDDFKTIGEGARVLAERVGGDTKEAYNTLIQAMASGRTMRLKEIGLNIDETQAVKDHAKALGVDATELNEHGQKLAKQGAVIAELNRILKEGGKATMDFGDTFDQARTKIVDWTDDLASGISNSKVLGAALNSVGDIIAAVFGAGDGQDAIKTIIHLIEQGALTVLEWARTAVTAGDLVARVFHGTQVVFDAVGMAVAKVGEYFFKLIGFIGSVASYIPIVGKQFGIGADAAKELSTYLGGVSKGFAEAGGAALESTLGTRDSSDMFVILDKTLEGVRNKMVDASAATDAHTSATTTNTKAVADNAAQVLSQNKLLDEYNKKVRELSSNLSSAKAMGAPIEFVAKQFGGAIHDVVEQATILGKKVPALVADAFLKISLRDASAKMAAEIDNIQKDLAEKIKKHADEANTHILGNLNETVAAQREASDIRARLSMNDLEYQKHIIEQEAQDKRDALKQDVEGYEEALTAIDDLTKAKMLVAEMDWSNALQQMELDANEWTKNVVDDITKGFSNGFSNLGDIWKGMLSQVTAGSTQALNQFMQKGLTAASDKLEKFQPQSEKGQVAFAAAGVGADMLEQATNDPKSKAGQVANFAAKGAKIGMIAGPWGMAIGAGVGALVGAFKEDPRYTQGKKDVAAFEDQLNSILTKTQQAEAGGQKWKGSVIAVRDAFLATGRTAQQADAVMHQLWDSKNPEQYKKAIDEINEALGEQKQDDSDLNAAIQEYGFSIDELGPKMRKQQLTEQAVKLENDFRVLVNSGIDVGTVIDKMSDKLNEYIQTSVRTGTEVPAEMKPMIEKMIEAGKLTDENGNKITDLGASGITFSETMTQGFDKIVKKFDELIDRLTGVKRGIEDIPGEKTITITTDHKDVNRRNDDDTPAFATEAYVRRPTLAIVGDTPEGEYVLKPSTVQKLIDKASALGAQAQGGNASVDFSPMTKEISRMRSDIRNMSGSLERAVRDGLLAAR